MMVDAFTIILMGTVLWSLIFFRAAMSETIKQ